MARPRKPERRDRQINVKLTEKEHAWVHKRALARGMKPTEFGRAQLLAERQTRQLPQTSAHLDPLFVAQLSRIGNNLNQMTRRFHEYHLPPPDDLALLLETIRDVIRKGTQHGT